MNVVDTFSKIILSIIADPSKLIKDLDKIGDSNAEQIMEWNKDLPHPVHECVHRAFEAQARLCPDAPAVSSWDGDLTYQELDDLSSDLAHYLVAQGVKKEDIVTLCFDKSKYVVVSMLAVLKAGAACLTLDMSHPDGRLRGLREQARSNVVLGTAATVKRLEGEPCTIVVLDEVFLDNLPACREPACLDVTPNNMAFVVFTSGSTGKPKGIMLEHETVCTSSRGHQYVFDIGPGSRVLQFSAFAFDVHISDIFTPLMYGAVCAMPSEKGRMDDIAGEINSLGASSAYLTPTVMTLFSPEDTPCLKKVASGGEPLTTKVAKKWADKVHLINVFGPSETSNWVSYHVVHANTTQPLTIGPGNDVSAWLIDPTDPRKLVPIGCVGELFVEGPILCRGYLDNPKQTESAFFTDLPWLPQRSAHRRRAYGTGDQLRHNSDGTLVYVGRKEATQVKIAGQRLEVGEVEFALAESNGVRYAVVSRPASGVYANRLVAVLVIHKQDSAEQQGVLQIVKGDEKAEVEAKLPAIINGAAEKLAAWMMPNVWIIVNAIPRNPAGKLDRAGVKKWVLELDAQSKREIERLSFSRKEMPRNTMEKHIQAIWCEVLNLSPDVVGVTDVFTRLGGDSVSAIQIVAKCRKGKLGLSVSDIMQSKTIEELALRAKVTMATTENTIDESIGVTDESFELSPMQKMHLTSTYGADDQYNRSFLLRVRNPIAEGELLAALDLLIEHHPMLRARLRKESGQWRQYISSNARSSYFAGYYNVCTVSELESIFKAMQQNLSLQEGPLLGAGLCNIETEDQLLFLTIHHFVVDLVAWRVLFQDLEQILTTGTISSEKSVSFQRWSIGQARHTREHIPPETALPYDVPCADYEYWQLGTSANKVKHRLTHKVTIDKKLLSAHFNDKLDTQPLDIFIAILFCSFARTFNDRTRWPTIFNESHGREPWDSFLDVSRTVGWFTTMYPLALPKKGDFDATDLLRVIHHVRDMRRAVPRNGWDYFNSRFLTKDGAEKFAHHSPMEIVFNYSGLYQQLERSNALLTRMPRETVPLHETNPELDERCVFSIGAHMDAGELQYLITHSCNIGRREQVAAWIRSVRELVDEACILLQADREM